MVCPLMLVTTSPGLTARPSGMFSQVGIRPTTLMAGLSSASARNTPSTLAAPHMSNFISSISGAGLIEMPPVSKVIPLPTRTVGATVLAAPSYRNTTKRNSSSEPLATAMNAPMPSLATCRGPNTSHLMRGSFANAEAARASKTGVAWLAGRLPHSLASSTPCTAATACSNADCTEAVSATPSTTLPMARGSGLDLVLVYT